MAEHERPAKAGRPKSEQKAEAILSAAGERFLASGFQGTSMDEVAEMLPYPEAVTSVPGANSPIDVPGRSITAGAVMPITSQRPPVRVPEA